MNLESGGLSVGWYLRSKPMGKVKRRVLEMRYSTSRTSQMDLSHNESARLATDALLDRGLAAYQEALVREEEVDFLSREEKDYILRKARDPSGAALGQSEDEQQKITDCVSDESETYFPLDSDCEPPSLDYGWPLSDSSVPLQGEPTAEVFFQSNRSTSIRDLLRESISKASTVLAIVMDTFSDVEIFCDLLEATKKRNVSVYLLLDYTGLPLFMQMCKNLQINSSHLTRMSIRSVCGDTYRAKSGRKFTGQIKEKFVIIDCTQVLAGTYSFTWLSWQIDRGLAMLFKGSNVKPFDLEFRQLHAVSEPVTGFPAPDVPHVSVAGQPAGLSQRTDAAAPEKEWQRPHYAARPRNPDIRATFPPAPMNLQSFLVAPRTQFFPQRPQTCRPVLRQRSFSSDYSTANVGRHTINSHLLGSPQGRFERFYLRNNPNIIG